MKLTKINYGSAVYFGVMGFIMYLIAGILVWTIKDELFTTGLEVTAVSTFVVAPVVACISAYLITLLAIAVYNSIAKQFPISWEVKK